MNWKSYLLIVLWLTAAFVYAEYANAGDYRVVTVNNSKHFSNSDKYNENHDGLGGEMRITDENWVGLRQYTNSFNDPAQMLYMLHEHEVNNKFAYGFQGGAAFGYENDVVLYATVYGTFTPVPSNALVPSIRVNVAPVVMWSGLVWEF